MMNEWNVYNKMGSKPHVMWNEWVSRERLGSDCGLWSNVMIHRREAQRRIHRLTASSDGCNEEEELEDEEDNFQGAK